MGTVFAELKMFYFLEITDFFEMLGGKRNEWFANPGSKKEITKNC